MSHIAQIQTEVRDSAAVAAACERLALPQPIDGSHHLFSGPVVGLGVQLPDWKYPIVCDLPSGQVRYDNFGGRWGEPVHLDRFLQRYAVEVTGIEARRLGHAVTETALADGSIKLTVQVAG